MKNLMILGLLLLGVACKGPNGGPGMKMTSCDVSKEEVKQILTGKSKNCSGLVSAAISVEEAEETLTDTFITDTDTVVTINDNTFWSIFDLGDKVIALKGKIVLEEDNDNYEETLSITTLLDEMTMAKGTITFGDDITLTVNGNTSVMSPFTPDTSIELEDGDITIVTNKEELEAAMSL